MTKIEMLVDGIEYDYDKLNQLIENKFEPSIRLATPAQVAETRKGVCHESAIFMAYTFNRKHVRYFTFMFTTRHNKTGAELHHSGSTWWYHKRWWIKDSAGRLVSFKSEEDLKDFLDDVFRSIESPIEKWVNLGQLKKFDWSYGEWIGQL